MRMPGLDGTGPLGSDPLTGRGLGPCGRGLAFRRGFGRGFSWRYVEPITLTKEEQEKVLEAELKQIEADKEEIEKKIKELKE